MIATSSDSKHPGSFRDPDGFVFRRSGEILRQINPGYQAHYGRLMESGLYRSLVDSGALVGHEELRAQTPSGAFMIIRPEKVRFISYPFEWCFGQLKDAALLTLEIQESALKHDLSLKDASAYNIQFVGARPVHIDTLSFECYEEGAPWQAYGQFCRHFLAPLALMARTDVRLGSLLRVHLDGIPLDLASCLLPIRSWLGGELAHIHLHARAIHRHSGRAQASTGRKLGKRSLLAIIRNLRGAVESCSWSPRDTGWSGYYASTNYSEDAVIAKQMLVREFINTVSPRDCWDMGANSGIYSRLASEMGIPTVAFDMDHGAVEQSYRESRARGERLLLSLMMNLTNPTPAQGWDSAERESLADRGPADLGLALALVHHLAIGNNLPFAEMARFFARVCRNLIIEFVPKSDSQVRRMLSSRKDIFDAYSEECFRLAFAELFHIDRREPILGTERVLYLMKRKES